MEDRKDYKKRKKVRKLATCSKDETTSSRGVVFET
jgi:hypothetical protein